MTTIVLITEHGLRDLSDEIFAFLSSQGCKDLYIAKPGSTAWAEGPYFYSSRGFFAAWRLYADSGESFIASTIPSQKDNRTYSTLTASAYGTHALTIAVPSRLRYKPSSEKPLAGMRVGVKDVLDLKGVRTGNGNRAYAQCYPPSTHSTDFMDMMIGQGAIIIGKTKTVEFAANQEVVADWVDYSYPFNPRGDFYIGATGSSTGSAAALGTYPWLDFTLGTDGGGSVRDPAVSNGVYGLRPTHNGKQEPGALIPCPSFQTIGYFTRSLAELLTISKFWCQWKSIKNKKFNVKKILMPPEYDVSVSEIQEKVEKFASALSEHLHAELVRTPLEDLWSSHRPSAISEPLFSYVEKTFIDVLTHDYYEITSDFREDYEAHFDHKPYVSPPTQWIWQKGASITPERLKFAHEEVKTHNEWFLNHVIRDKDPKASTLMIVPRYYDSHRDDHLPVPNEREFYGFDSNLHASFSGVPNIVIPIGQAKYKSHITDKVELLPFSASIVGAKGKSNFLKL
ncbi:amidase signature domain-containing protein [Bisporella sp. PMI_857]|nr:amidase signature domain-containing protein [Bisporella sp. PMI_857]